MVPLPSIFVPGGAQGALKRIGGSWNDTFNNIMRQPLSVSQAPR